jgi:hypothetical protein
MAGHCGVTPLAREWRPSIAAPGGKMGKVAQCDFGAALWAETVGRESGRGKGGRCGSLEHVPRATKRER